MLTQRQIDIWRVEAEEYALKMREQFMQGLMQGRAPVGPQPQQAQPPMPPQQPQQAQPPMEDELPPPSAMPQQ